MSEEMGELRELEVERYLLDCVEIHPEDLDTEFQRLPGDVAYWGERYSNAVEFALRAKLDLDVIKAKLHLEIKEDALASGSKMTVGDLDARVHADPAYVDAAARLVTAEAEKQRMRSRVDAVNAKRDMLQSLGAKIRVQMMADPVVREQVAAGRLGKDGGW